MNMMNMGQLSTYQQPQQQQVQPQQNNGFNIQEFMKFAQQMKGKDPNQMLQQMLNNGQITQEQLNKATNQSQEICQMLKLTGVIK